MTQNPTRRAALAKANKAMGSGRPALAKATLIALLEEHPPAGQDAQVLALLGRATKATGHPRQARTYARRAIEIDNDPSTRLLLARCEQDLGNLDEALDICRAIVDSHPEPLRVRLTIASIHEKAGQIEEARQTLEPLMESARAEGLAGFPRLRYLWARVLRRDGRTDEAIETLDSMIDENTEPAFTRSALHLKATLLDESGRYDEAFDAASAGNRLIRATFDPGAHAERLDQIIARWSAANLDAMPLAACDSEAPVFVAGLPRSGTSLLDRIIDIHPQAFGVGEIGLPFAIDLANSTDPVAPPPGCFGELSDPAAWTRGAEDYLTIIREFAGPEPLRIANKAISNPLYLGTAARLFPRARTIQIIRDPRDVAVSCYLNSFNEGFAWTTRLDWIAAYWDMTHRLMEHWKSVLDMPILDVHYERLARQPDVEIPRIIDFLGLEWNDACLEFHRSKRVLPTLSYDQVIRPMYTSSIGRHRNYATHLEDVAFPAYDPA